MSGPPGVSHKVSDVVAERVLHCLEELLHKCPLGSTDQVVYYKISLSRTRSFRYGCVGSLFAASFFSAFFLGFE